MMSNTSNQNIWRSLCIGLLTLMANTYSLDQLVTCSSHGPTSLHQSHKPIVTQSSSCLCSTVEDEHLQETMIPAWQLTSHDQQVYIGTDVIHEMASPLLEHIIKTDDTQVSLPHIKSAASFKRLIEILDAKKIASPTMAVLHDFLDLSDYLSIDTEKVSCILRATAETDLTLLCKVYQERIARKNQSELILQQTLENLSPYYPQKFENIHDQFGRSYNTLQFDESTMIGWSERHAIVVWQKDEHEDRWYEQQILGAPYNFDAEIGHTSTITSVIKIDDATIASASADYAIIIWKKVDHNWYIYQKVNPTYNIEHEQGHVQWVTSLLLFDEKTLISGSWDCSSIVWEKGDDQYWHLHRRLGATHNNNPQRGHVAWVIKIEKINDTTIATCSFDRTAILWRQSADGNWHMQQRIGYVRNIHDKIGHTAPISTVVALDDDTIITGSWDCSCLIWSRRADGRWDATQRLGKAYNHNSTHGHIDWITSIAVLNKNKIVSGSADSTALVWERSDPGIWKCTHRLGEANNTQKSDGHTSPIIAIDQSADGKIIKTYGIDSSCISWKKNPNQFCDQTLERESWMSKISSFLLSIFYS